MSIDINDNEAIEFLRQQMGIQGAQTSRIHVRFSLEPVQNIEKSSEAGRPIFDEVEFVTKMVPGDKDNVVFRPVRNEDVAEYTAEYRAFKAGIESPASGTPLNTLPFLSKAQVAEYSIVGVKTAEQLVNMGDGHAIRFTGHHAIKQRVQNFLDAAKGEAVSTKLQSELDDTRAQIANMKEMMEKQAELIKQLTPKKLVRE